MDIMKKFIMGIMLAGMLVPGLIYAQVKSYVGIVRQQYISEYVDRGIIDYIIIHKLYK